MKRDDKPPRLARETNAAPLRLSMLRRVARLADLSGEIRLVCAPSMTDHHLATLSTVFAAFGKTFSDEERASFRSIIEKMMEKGFRASQASRMVVKYSTEPPPHPGLRYEILLVTPTFEEEYERWVAMREPPLFGKHPDAKVMRTAAELGAPADVPVLDVGAGTGRNAFPLARLGNPTGAVEIAPALAAELKKEAAAQRLAVEVFEGDALDPALRLPKGAYKLVVLAEVVASHFRTKDEVRKLFERSAELLVPGGVLLFSAFTTLDGYKPEPLARELSIVSWCPIFTRGELAAAVEGLPFDRIAEESVYEYERAHLPADAWPPTGWFAQWSRGGDLFDLPPARTPVEVRWFSYRRR